MLLALSSCSADPESRPGRERGRGTEREPDARSEVRAYGRAETLGAFRDASIVESSGVVASRRSPGNLWTHNDSGGTPEIYCVRRNGASCGSVWVDGADVIDWEDIAAGPSDLFIGDIGDNAAERRSIVVYRLPDPVPPGADEAVAVPVAERIELRYPRGAHDAEALLVHPVTGALYIVTKDSPALVYRARPDGRLRLVGALRLPGLVSFATGGDISPDGRHVVIGTYGPAFELSLEEGASFDRIWTTEPRRIELPFARQREAIAYRLDGRALIATSEGARAAIIEVELKD